MWIVRGATSPGGKDNEWGYILSFVMNFVEERLVFYDLALNSFSCKSIIGVCKFYKLGFYIRVRMKWSGGPGGELL